MRIAKKRGSRKMMEAMMNRCLIGILLVILLGEFKKYHRLLCFTRNGDFTWKFWKEEYKVIWGNF
ncbi:MAG: hypothetical protein Ct9H300mP21_11080 [Pseudomonadota bacterium]|nr:MAG: hypothetical protein Ct9H300mP21_11080 [Pseudomonadota bacterium]